MSPLKSLLLALCLPCVAFSATEREVVAAVLVLEAGVEGVKGMNAVMEVIQNRAGSRSKLAVVLKPKQFSCMNGKTPEQAIVRAKRHLLWWSALKLAGGVDTNITGGADHYYAHRVMQAPDWADPRKRTVVLGGHTFYKLKGSK